MSEQSQENPTPETKSEPVVENTQQQSAPSRDLSPQDLYDVINGLPDRVIDAIRQVSGQNSNPTDPPAAPTPAITKSGAEKFADWWTGTK